MLTKVTLRRKPINGNKESLYLDFYPPILNLKNGKKTRREFLKLYVASPIKYKKRKDSKGLEKSIPIYDENTVMHNIIEDGVKETLRMAEAIKDARQNRLNKPEIYTDFEREQLRVKELGEIDFVKYFNDLANKRKASNYDNWVSAYKYLFSFTNGNLKFSELNIKFCNDFKEYLLTTKSNKDKSKKLSQNSASSYFNKFKATLKQALKDELLVKDLNSMVTCIKEKETLREYLTIEELNILIRTDCKDEMIKKIGIFSALTSLAFKEMQNLKWGDIRYTKEIGYYIPHFRQKSAGANNLPISDQAYKWIGEPKEHNEKVFKGLEYSKSQNEKLRDSMRDAGINKYISFHCFRHTYAVIQLLTGTDIYTLSKMMGHKNLKTTEIYAKIVDSLKIDAAKRIVLEIDF